MKKILLWVFIPVPFLLNNACISSHDYSQSYIIVANKEIVGKEIVNEKTDRKGNRVCLSEQEMDTPASKEGKRKTIRTKTVFQEGELFPASYSYESSTGTSYDLEVKDGQIIKTLKEGEPRESKTPLEPGMCMLDPTVFHTIGYWIRQYDVKKGEKQVFQTYLLPAGSVEKLSVILIETFMDELEGKVQRIKNYEIEIGDGLNMLVWVDKDNRLCQMVIKGSNINVVRSDLYEKSSSQKDKDAK